MAKHWKQLLKHEVTTKKPAQEEEHEDFSLPELLRPNTTTDETSLDDIAASNINLKSLLEEQKELEQNMNALTGKTEEHSTTNKQYDNEIKSVYQKRKEARKEEIKKKKLLLKRKNKANEKERWDRKENGFFTIDLAKKIKKKTTAIANSKKKILKPIENSTQKIARLKSNKQQHKLNLKPIEKGGEIVQKALNVGKNFSDKIQKIEKKTTTITKNLGTLSTTKLEKDRGFKKLNNTLHTVSTSIKKANTLTNDISKNLTKASSLLSSNLQNKEKKATDQKGSSNDTSFATAIETLGKVAKVAKKTTATFTKIDTKSSSFIEKLNQLKQKENGFKNPLATLKTNNKEVNALSEKLNKVTNFYKNTKKHLDTATTTINKVDKLFNKTELLQKSEEKNNALLALNSLNKVFTKKENKEAKEFNTINVSEIFSAAKQIKKFADELPTKKKSKSKKDPFSL